jgi:hypothetical protein
MFAAGVFESDHTARRHSISLRIVLISFASFKKGQEQRSNIRWPLTFLLEAGSCRDFFYLFARPFRGIYYAFL